MSGVQQNLNSSFREGKERLPDMNGVLEIP